MNMGTLDAFFEKYSIPPRARPFLRRKFSSVACTIAYGRLMAYRIEHQEETIDIAKLPKSVLNLISAIDTAGFIRHDITPESFCLNRLYSKVFHIDSMLVPCRIEDLCGDDEKEEAISEKYNKSYDLFKNPSSEQIVVVKNALKGVLPEYECDVISYFHNLLDDESRDYKMSDYRVARAYDNGIQILRNTNALPPILSFSDKIETRFLNLFTALYELYRDPLFKKAADIRGELRSISRLPFNLPDDAKKRLAELSDGTYDFTSIEYLDLSVRSFNCLKRAGINTIADIVAKPADEWIKVKNLGVRSIEEVIRKVREYGLTSFGGDIIKDLESTGRTVTIQ